jgi:hypothetical protein
MPQFGIRTNNFQSVIARRQQAYDKDLVAAGRYATNRASVESQAHIRARMKQAGLGGLANAVGQTSALKKRAPGMWGVIYAKGQAAPDNRGAGAIEAYSQGVVIRARNTSWLAIATNAVPKMTGAGGRRRRMTPFIYQTSGWQQKLGRLEFRPISPNEALLVVKNVTLSPKTGRAKRAAGRTRTRIPMKETVVFVLIRWTARAQRFDQKLIVAVHNKDVSPYMLQWFEQNRS